MSCSSNPNSNPNPARALALLLALTQTLSLSLSLTLSLALTPALTRCVVLFDEVDRAAEGLLTYLMNFLDQGQLTDG